MTHSTHAYLSAANNLNKISTAKMRASGLELTLHKLSRGDEPGQQIAAIQLDDEAIDAIKAVVLDSIKRTLTFRKILVSTELRDISTYLDGLA